MSLRMEVVFHHDKNEVYVSIPKGVIKIMEHDIIETKDGKAVTTQHTEVIRGPHAETMTIQEFERRTYRKPMDGEI
jgi:hypothetical protein